MGSGWHGDPLQRWLAEGGAQDLDRFTAGAMDVLGVVDRDLVVRYVNWTAPGLTREEAIGCPVLDLAPPDYRDSAERVYRRVLRTGRRERIEIIFEDDNKVMMWDVRVGPIHAGAEVIGLFTISTDVTDERRARADRDRFFSLSLDLLVVASADGHFKRANPAFGEALGYEVEEIIGRHFVEILHPEDLDNAQATFESLARGRPTATENRCRRKDGQYRVLSWRATVDPITGDVYAVARDITDQRAIETQLHRAQKMEAIGQLAGGIAHDFNNLTQAILGNTELALEESSGEPARIAGYLRGIEGAASRAADLTRQLLAFSRRQPLHRKRLDLGALVQGLSEILRRLLPENIEVQLRTRAGLPAVQADPSQLEQVVVNLCVNARDAMEQGGRLVLETDQVELDPSFCQVNPWARTGRFVRLRVADTGAGMTDEVRERIFEPFFTTKGATHGTGLGLATVYGIIQQHEGLIQAYSEPGAGTTFDLYLPAEGTPAPEVQPQRTGEEPALGRETILLAEDEESVRRVVVTVLERAGYRVLAADNGAEAVQLLRDSAEPVDLAVLDVVMPGMGGPEAWEQMHALREGLRVLFVSGYAGERYLERLPRDAEVLSKPFRGDELLRRVRAALDR